MKAFRSLLVLVIVATLAFTIGFKSTASAHTSIWDWNTSNHGFFKHNAEGGAWNNVWPTSSGPSVAVGDVPHCRGNGLAIPTWVDTWSEYYHFTVCKLWYGNTQEHIGAAFIISTTIGITSINPTDPQVDEFRNRLAYAASRGWINFGATWNCSSAPRNTFYQSTRQDVGWYWGCPTGGNAAITIHNGSDTYIIMRFCANPIGNMPPIADDPPPVNFNMSGTSGVSDTTVNPGQQINFTHSLTNAGPTNTSPSTIGWTTQSASSAAGPWSTVSTGNQGTFASGQTKQGFANQTNFTVPSNAAPGSQICRRISWTPDTQGGGSEASTPACATVQYNFSLTTNIGVVVTGVDGPAATSAAELGDSVTFTYTVTNGGATASQAATCAYRQATYTGYSTTAPSTTFTPAGANCSASTSRTFPASPIPVTVATETVALNTPNQSVCRSLTVSPATQGGGTSTPAQACVHVANRPYMRAYGGDVTAGGGVETASGACSTNSNAAIIGWNRRSAGNWAGTGTQFAAYALSMIYDFSSALSNTAASTTTAGRPADLSFANTGTNTGSGNFGGVFGSAVCAADHFAPAQDLTSGLGASTAAGLASGTYKRTGDLTVTGGTIAAGSKVTIYVDGNVRISNNITYGGSGSWTSSTIPSFRLIASGNVFIDRTVTQLDGLYVAQVRQSSGTGGTIYTCSLVPFTAPTIAASGGSLGSQCNVKLTVNGSFVANSVQLLRTSGTLRQSAVGDVAPGGGAAAEVFNYNPALWISQPSSAGGAAEYDAINSLPPVL